MISNECYRLPVERMWDRAVGDIGPIDKSYTMVARCVLRDIKQVVSGRDIVEYEVVEYEVVKYFNKKL